MTAREVFEKIVSEANVDDNVIGLFLGGSRGKGWEDEYSDYDIFIIAHDDKIDSVKEKYMPFASDDVEVFPQSFTEFVRRAEWKSDTHWDRYNYAHIRAMVDKTGDIQTHIDGKGCIPEKERDAFIREQLDGYLNQLYRSVKCTRRGDSIGAHLEATISIPYLLDSVFALSGRIAPYGSYLSREMEHCPLSLIPMTTEEFLRAIEKVLTNGDLETQQSLAKMFKNIFCNRGYADVFESWKGKDQWAMDYVSS